MYKEEKISILADIVNPWKSRILRNISNIFLENLEGRQDFFIHIFNLFTAERRCYSFMALGCRPTVSDHPKNQTKESSAFQDKLKELIFLL